MVTHLLFLFAIAASLLPQAQSFSPAPGWRPVIHYFTQANNGNVLGMDTTLSSGKKSSRLHSTDDKQAEIAALEEKLRQLKADDESSTAIVVDVDDEPQFPPMGSTSVEETTPDDGMEGETDDSVMFSERWKETKDDYLTKKDESNMGGIVKVGLGLAFVIFLGFFSQIPVGEENLMRYQDVKGNPSRIDLGDLNPVE